MREYNKVSGHDLVPATSFHKGKVPSTHYFVFAVSGNRFSNYVAIILIYLGENAVGVPLGVNVALNNISM